MLGYSADPPLQYAQLEKNTDAVAILLRDRALVLLASPSAAEAQNSPASISSTLSGRAHAIAGAHFARAQERGKGLVRARRYTAGLADRQRPNRSLERFCARRRPRWIAAAGFTGRRRISLNRFFRVARGSAASTRSTR